MASTSLGTKLDLQLIARSLDGAEYEPTEFPGLIYRLKEPKTAILLFQSGKVVCTGGKSWNQVHESIRTISGLIRKGGQKIIAQPKIEIQHTVATANLESEINLNSIAVTLGLDRVEDEPEQFPGLVVRLDEPRVVVLLFGSGKLVCTGARRPADVSLAVQHITQELRRAGLLREQRAAPSSEPSRPARKHRPAAATPSEPALGPSSSSGPASTPAPYAV